MSAPREDSKGLVLPFRRREKPRAQDGAPVEGLEKYAETSEPDDYRQRMTNNVLALVFCILLVAAGVWIADRIAEMRKNSGLRAVGPAELRERERAARQPVVSRMIPKSGNRFAGRILARTRDRVIPGTVRGSRRFQTISS